MKEYSEKSSGIQNRWETMMRTKYNKKKKHNEMRYVNNERGQHFRATSLSHWHTATVSYRALCLASLCSAANLDFDYAGAIYPLQITKFSF